MARQHRVTIREIARMTGVSTQTVSRVINGRPDVAPATRNAVEAAIAQVGFQPSAVARSLVHRRSLTLGVVVAGLKYFGVSQTLNGITEASERAGYGLLLKELSPPDGEDIVRVIAFLAAHRVEGIIFAAPLVGQNADAAGAHLPPGSPPMILLKSPASATYTTIGVDNEGGAKQATDHLLALGRHRIAHVSGPLDWLEARERRDGWQATLRAAGTDAGPIAEGSWSSASGRDAFERILDAQPDVDAVFAANDQMALGVLHAAHRRGVRVPDDVAVVGFDGLPEAAHFTPSLTTVRQPLAELGGLAVERILAQGESEGGPAAVENITLATELIVRESAPAPTGA